MSYSDEEKKLKEKLENLARHCWTEQSIEDAITDILEFVEELTGEEWITI